MRTGIERVLIDSQVTPYQVIDGDHADYGGDENQHSARHAIWRLPSGPPRTNIERADDNKRGNDCSRPDRQRRHAGQVECPPKAIEHTTTLRTPSSIWRLWPSDGGEVVV